MISLQKPAMEKLVATHLAMDLEFANWRPHLQEVAQYLLPRRYATLAENSPLAPTRGNGSNRAAKSRNNKILDSTGTKALRDLAAGMLNGITSPARPWLRIREMGYEHYRSIEHKAWYEEVARRMLLVMAGSNFYNSLAIVYLDLAAFGSACCLIYEDFDDIIRCYNSPLGEFRFGVDHRGVVCRYSRTFALTVEETVKKFGIENVSKRVQEAHKRGGADAQNYITICHLIEPNLDDDRSIPSRFGYREFYWEAGTNTGQLLQRNGYGEKPGLFTRWEVTGNDIYGTSPGQDALPDVIQLQHETLRKAQGMDKIVNPPIVVESATPFTQVDLLPGGMTRVGSGASFGAKAVYQAQLPLNEMTVDINFLRMRIQETFHNDLFRMISSLETVRSATEIDARREEKLVLLGAVLERFENEALDPAVKRIYSIMLRKELLPEPPEDLDPTAIDVQYVSILSDAQRAIGTVSIERFTQFYGNMLSVDPELKMTVNMDEILRDYADRLNVTAAGLYSREQAAEARQQANELNQTREAALVGKDLTDAASNLSQTEVGGGRKALDILLGG